MVTTESTSPIVDAQSEPPLHEQHLLELTTYGFTIVESVLSPAVIAELRGALVETEARIGTESTFGGSASHVSNLVTVDPVFFQVIDHPKILPLLEQIMGRDLILGSLNSRIVRPGDGDQKLHGDIPSGFIRPGAPVMMNTVWMLDDFTEEIGATRIVPFSHLSDKHQPPDVNPKYVVQATAKAGSVLVFNGQCWHGGGTNRTERSRYALFAHYRLGTWMRFQVDPHHRFKPDWLPLLNARQKALLRMTNGLAPHAADFYEY